MDRPSRDHVLMEHAKLVALRGTCSRLQVGAIVAREGRILVTGYNGAPAGLAHCDHDCRCPKVRCTHGPQSFNPGCPHDQTGTGVQHQSNCPQVVACTTAVHAEANAIAFAARYGMSLDGGTLYCTDTPCIPCAQLMINAGLTEVHYIREYRDSRGLELLRAARLTVHQHES